ncbi:MAG: hypothetical protein ACRDYC_01330, partial [Acidimicrobiales bacterium]
MPSIPVAHSVGPDGRRFDVTYSEFPAGLDAELAITPTGTSKGDMVTDTSGSWDRTGTSETALRSAAADFGKASLSSSAVLRSALSDPLASLPRERELLITAAGQDVVGTLEGHLREGMDPETAASLTASALSDRTPFDAGACRWAVAQFARALGYQVSDVSSPAQGAQPAGAPFMGAPAAGSAAPAPPPPP